MLLCPIPMSFLDVSDQLSGGSGSLTYEPFYGLREKAFSLSADPRFLFRSPAHGPAFDALLAGIRRREGLIVLTGEIGTGKTTLCRSVLQQLDRRTFSSFVADPFVSREDLLKTLLVDFGVISIGDLNRGRFNGASRSDLSYPLYEFLDSLVPLQAFAVVVIDEAQNLSLPLLEEIRILSELERREKLLQVVLVGQPELRSSLKLPQMRQVDQRVSVRCELSPLDAEGVRGYVAHRLSFAGSGRSAVEFTKAALEAVHEGSAGVPRLINRICDRALQRAYASRTTRIEADFVWNAIEDLGLRVADTKSDVSSPSDASSLSDDSVLETLNASVPTLTQAAGPLPVPAITALPDESMTGLDAFEPESRARLLAQRLMNPAASRRWMAAAATAALFISASVGVPAWYTGAQPLELGELDAMVPPAPSQLALPAAPAAPVKASELLALQSDGSVPGPVAVATNAPSTRPAEGYSIVVASFRTRDRAERVVADLTSAGYPASAVERSGGPTGRLLQVLIGGYRSTDDVQRDLQRIRELPGGYADARVVQQN